MPEPIASPTPASTAAPAVSAPASTSAPASSPAVAPSARASFERVAAAAESTPTATPATGTAALASTPTEGAITPPVAGEGTTAAITASASDGTPEHRIQAAVRNARAEMETELGWARTYGTREDVDRAVSQIRALDANPVAFYRQLTEELRDAGLLPTDGTPVTPTTPDLTDPEPDLRSTDGKTAFTADAVRKLVDNAIARTKQELLGAVKPALDFTQQSQQQQRDAQLRQHVETEAKEAMQEMKALPHFTEHKDAVRAAYLAIPTTVRAKIGMRAALYQAYTAVLRDTVLPTLSSRVQTHTVEDLRRAAVAGTAGVPTGAVPPTKPVIRDGDVGGLAKHMERLAAQMAQPTT